MNLFPDIAIVELPKKEPKTKSKPSKEARRRYYLHRKLKNVARIDVHGRTLFYDEDLLDKITVKQLRYFLELQVKFNYTAQQEIT